MSDGHIPFNKPSLEGQELDYIKAAVEGGRTATGGPFASRVSDLLRDYHGAADVLMTTSCTDALEMTAMLLNLEPGDTVIVPSFTFVSSALAYTREGARILFADIEPVTLGIDPNHVAELLDESVRAVVAVHYAGIGCEIADLKTVLKNHPDVALIEDNAHGLFGEYRGRPLGTFGRFSTLSFHETKNFVCGEGGALVLNDEADIDRAHVLYDKGTNRRAFTLGQVDKYTWSDVGSSFGMSDINAAYLLAQLEARDTVLHRRKAVFNRYFGLLAPHAAELGIDLPVVPQDRRSGYHMFYVLVPDRADRDHALAHLRKKGIHGTFHYVPLHSSPAGSSFAARPPTCPVTDQISGRLLRLPFYTALLPSQIDRVVEELVSALD